MISHEFQKMRNVRQPENAEWMEEIKRFAFVAGFFSGYS